MRALSLFSGAGGDTYGIHSAGVDVVGFVEIEQDMINTHLANFPDCHLICEDVCKATEEHLAPYVDNIDIMFAGFPCQSFSKAGKKSKSDSRADLFKEFVRLASIVRPKWIIGENVKHILKMKTKDDECVPDVICRSFAAIGYAMAEPHVLKAEKFGVPQKRERCFFVGCYGSENLFSWEIMKEHNTKRTLKDILEESLEQAIEITDEQAIKFKIQRFKTVDVTLEPTGTPPLNLRKCLEKNELSFGKRITPTHSEVVDPDGLAKTLICTYSRMPRMFVPIIANGKKYLRPFTVNEAKQIQGFPANYIITGSKASAIKQIGNAVPPQLVHGIVRAIID